MAALQCHHRTRLYPMFRQWKGTAEASKHKALWTQGTTLPRRRTLVPCTMPRRLQEAYRMAKEQREGTLWTYYMDIYSMPSMNNILQVVSLSADMVSQRASSDARRCQRAPKLGKGVWRIPHIPWWGYPVHPRCFTLHWFPSKSKFDRHMRN